APRGAARQGSVGSLESSRKNRLALQKRNASGVRWFCASVLRSSMRSARCRRRRPLLQSLILPCGRPRPPSVFPFHLLGSVAADVVAAFASVAVLFERL